MGVVREDLSGGLVDGPDPAQLQPGQLSAVQNAVYLPNSPALQRARGRVAFGTATATASDVNGLRDCDFDTNAGHYIIGQVSGVVPAYVSGFMGDTTTFGILTTAITAGSQLEVAQFNNRYFLMNGVSASASAIGSNKVFYLSATAASSAPTVRQHGMLPVTTPSPTATAASAFTLSVTGYYEYWTTEVAKITQDGAPVEIEGTFAGTPATYFISATSVAPIVQMPTIQNPSITTHWRIYRSPKKEFSTDHMFPAGFLVGTVGTATAQFIDTLTPVAGSQVLPGSVATAGEPYSNFATASALMVADTNYASATAAGSQGAYNFNFGGFRGNVQGISVEVKAYSPSAPSLGLPFSITLGKRGSDGKFQGPAYSRTNVVTASAVAGAQVITFGGATDRWAPFDQVGFLDTDFDTNFMAVITNSRSGITLGVDYVKISVNYGAGTDSSVVQFPTVVYTFGDIVAQVGKNGPPPSSSTGDLYQGSFVLNDVSVPSLIRYSFPDQPEYFPSTYYIDFDTRDNDTVRLIRVVNNRLVVCLDNSTWRVNYLPSERDASFDRGKAIEPISQTFGCVNPMCACIFTSDNTSDGGSSEQLAWVSQKGIHITDGFSFKTLTNDINWRNILSLTSTSSPIALVNDPENQDLLLLYQNNAFGNESFKILHLSYAAQHMTSGRLKVSGQVNARNYDVASTSRANPTSIWTVPRTNGNTSVLIGYGSATAAGGGMVYRESGSTIPAQDPNMTFTTRRMFLAGEGNEVELHNVYGYIGSNSATAGIDMIAKTIKTNDDAGEVTKGTHTVAFGGRRLGKFQYRQIAEGLRLSFAVTGTPNQDLSWDYLLLQGQGFGAEDSGKGN